MKTDPKPPTFAEPKRTTDLPERAALRRRRNDADRLTDDECVAIFRSLSPAEQERLLSAEPARPAAAPRTLEAADDAGNATTNEARDTVAERRAAANRRR